MSAMQPRLVPLRPEQLDAAQRRLYDAVLASPRGQGGARRLIQREDGSLTGPFDAWLRSPVLGEHLERVGMALRTDTVLPAAARETAVLVVARAWSADFEWWVHGLVARREGVPPAAIEAIGQGRRPAFEDPACQAAHDVAHALVERRRLDSPTLERAREVLGERALVEVITLVGFYQLVSGILESFHPPGPSAEFPVVGVPSSAARAGFDLYEAASTTRAVRRLRPDPIPEPVLRRVLEAATWAPSGGNLQPWHVIAVRDPARKNGLAELYRGLWSDYAAQRRALLARLPETVRTPAEKALGAGDYLATHLQDAPVIAPSASSPSVSPSPTPGWDGPPSWGAPRSTRRCRTCCSPVGPRASARCSPRCCAAASSRCASCSRSRSRGRPAPSFRSAGRSGVGTARSRAGPSSR